MLRHLLPRLRRHAEVSAEGLWPDFEDRLEVVFPELHAALYALYGHRHDFVAQVEAILCTALDAAIARPESLRALDARRESAPAWTQDHRAIGGVCYVDLFAGDLRGVEEKIPYFRELGITYLHLMPLFVCPEGRSDGGYAVSDYRSVNPALGTMDALQALAATLREQGISLVLDFIYNHTSDQHAWAQRAREGDTRYRDFYLMYPDRRLPERFEQTLREIFPEESPGSFTYDAQMDLWVWTSFKSYQWDLNYANPEVFRAMAGEMLFLANAGVEVLRLDAVAFAWKEMGTACESLPQVCTLVEAFNRLARLVAPALLFKSEAIVHPDEVARYIDPRRCQLSYNPLLMSLLWESLATRDATLLRRSMAHRFAIHPDTQWVNYVRCHDDIGWTFSDEDAFAVGIRGFDHRAFLNRFYTGRFEGSFARGVPFQMNPKTGDCRVCGSAASLAGLEKALAEETAEEVDLAIRRLLLLYSVIFSIGGIPLVYLGDELAVLNDYSYADDPDKHDDSRWVQRPRFGDETFAARKQAGTPAHAVFGGFRRMVAARQAHPALGGHGTSILDVGDNAVFAYRRENAGARVLVLNNFSERQIRLDAGLLLRELGSAQAQDIRSGAHVGADGAIVLAPYDALWLAVDT